ncbi:MAG TPA: transporter associated domain-containing protein, partial [Verrucomicrobiae bacterium]|nr:transporter associated domain-containing protein [Verrucomicrobiae bacterium]
TLPLHELAELIQEPLQEEGITTVSGWVTLRLGGFPKPGDALSLGNYNLTVEEMEGLRVAKLRLKMQEPKLAHSDKYEKTDETQTSSDGA